MCDKQLARIGVFFFKEAVLDIYSTRSSKRLYENRKKIIYATLVVSVNSFF